MRNADSIFSMRPRTTSTKQPLCLRPSGSGPWGLRSWSGVDLRSDRDRLNGVVELRRPSAIAAFVCVRGVRLWSACANTRAPCARARWRHNNVNIRLAGEEEAGGWSCLLLPRTSCIDPDTPAFIHTTPLLPRPREPTVPEACGAERLRVPQGTCQC